MTTQDELRLTRQWLRLEHEAIWVLGLVGARFPALADSAVQGLEAHRTTRDRLTDAVAASGGPAVAPEPAYDVTDPQDATAARALVRDVESRIAAVCVALVAEATDRRRDRAVRGLRTAALAHVRWGGAPEPFPGLD